MKKIVLTLILFGAMSLGLINAQNVNIPDANFKTYLVGNPNINTNSDTEISITEASSYTGGISCSNCGISNLEGIEAFTEITVLQVFFNQITSVDLSQNTKITQLLIEHNQLAGDLDLHLLTQLTDFKGHTNAGLKTINIANGNNTNFTRFEAQSCDSLYCIQVDDAAWSYNNWSFYDNLNTGFTEDCGTIVYIPDANFKLNLVENSILNANDDSMISYTEAANFPSVIDVDNLNISSLVGLEALTNITVLNCRNNQLSNINIAANTALIYLDCRDNQLTNLNTSTNMQLTDLNCGNNQITSLDISTNINLIEFNCTTNDLTSLNTSNNPALEIINCGENQITSLDVSANPALLILGSSNNDISTLDLSSNTNLISISARLNQLTSFNIANGNNANVTTSNFRLDANPTLTCIQVDDVAYSTTNWNFIDAQTSYSLDCSGGISCTVNIPDANFKSCLVNNMLINTNGDSEISCDEAAAFTGEMDCSWAGANGLTFSNSTGMEAFTAMTELQLNSQHLTSLDLTTNIGLKKVDMHQNFDLTSLNIIGLTNLVELKCFSTALPTLDVSTNSALETIQCDRMDLTSLDVSGLTNLSFLDCYNNEITSLDITGCTALQTLRIQDNQFANVDFLSADIPIQTLWIARNPLTTFNVSMLDSLKSVSLDDNDLLTNIDLSQNTALNTLRCYRNDLLESINLANTNNENFWFIGLTENPSLTCLQVDDVAWSNDPANWDETLTNMYGHFFYSFDAQTDFSADCGIASSINFIENPSLPFSIFPNPTNQQLNIEIENAEISQINIIDLSGKIVRTVSQNASAIDVSNLDNGIYFIKIKTDKGILNNRFIKQ